MTERLCVCVCVCVGTCGPAEKSNFETSVLRLLSAKYCDDKYLGETGDCVCGVCVCVCVCYVCVCREMRCSERTQVCTRVKC